MGSQLRVSLVQLSGVWENKQASLLHFGKRLKRLKGKTDLTILPETFTTGFSMQAASLAETMDGKTVTILKKWAKEFDFAIAGSFIAEEAGCYYNRAFFVTPEGACETFDKHHLFRMGREHDFFTAGDARGIVHYLGWNIRLLVCYDLRFPVWSRNVQNAYDLLIYVANWPTPRAGVWKTLLPARAIENIAFVCGVNRVGTDGNGLTYSGNSVIYSPKGQKLVLLPAGKETIRTCVLNKNELDRLREKFPVWKDADLFSL
ncbi:MAG: amidohydrolase [Massilibacteroides sp.]|nr:amidohydrolase [Massilibacteroides sp.]